MATSVRSPISCRARLWLWIERIRKLPRWPRLRPRAENGENVQNEAARTERAAEEEVIQNAMAMRRALAIQEIGIPCLQEARLRLLACHPRRLLDVHPCPCRSRQPYHPLHLHPQSHHLVTSTIWKAQVCSWPLHLLKASRHRKIVLLPPRPRQSLRCLPPTATASPSPSQNPLNPCPHQPHALPVPP